MPPCPVDLNSLLQKLAQIKNCSNLRAYSTQWSTFRH
jgi:hypothetical protein